MTIDNEEVITYKSKPEFSQKRVRPKPEMKHPYPALESTSIYLNSSGIDEYNLIEVGEYGFNNIPLVSFGYKFCEALIIRDPKVTSSRALFHILSSGDPSEYVDELINFFQSSDLEAVVIAAGKTRDKLVEACNSKGIRILQTYIIPKKGEQGTYAYDVIVRPELGKILINIDELGMKEINF